jgi:hypothetical protein
MPDLANVPDPLGGPASDLANVPDPLAGWQSPAAPATATAPPASPKKGILETSFRRPPSAAGPGEEWDMGDTGLVAAPGVEPPMTIETASGMLHGAREGAIDKLVLGAANVSDWLGLTSNKSAEVRQQNQQGVQEGIEGAKADPYGYSAGHLIGRVGAQAPILGGAAAAARAIPYIGPFIAGTAGADIPGALGAAIRTLAGATSGTASGAGSAVLAGEDPKQGALWGGVTGLGLSGISQAIERLFQTTAGTRVPPEVRTPSGQWQPSAQTVERANAADRLQTDHDVPVMAGQITSDPLYRITDAPWSQKSGDLANQQEAVGRRAIGLMSGSGDTGATPGAPALATDALMDAQRNRISGNFQAVAGRNNIDFTNDLAPGLTRLGMTPMDKGTRDTLAPYLQDITNGVTRDPVTGQPAISGAKYLDLTQRDSPLQNLASSGGLPGKYAQQTIDLLHNGLKASASPADQALLDTSRDQWRAWHAIDDARNSDGSFEPKDLFKATSAQQDRYGGTQGILDGLARDATTVIQPTYTASPLATGGVLGGGGGIGLLGGLGAAHYGSGLLGALGGPVGAAAGTAGFAAPLALQALNRSPAAVQRAIDLLRQGAPYTGFTGIPLMARPGFIATEEAKRNQ